jgi:hypothetical protein
LAIDAHQIRGMLLLASLSAAVSSADISATLLILAWAGDAWLRLSNPVDAETCDSTWLQGFNQALGVVSGEIGPTLLHLSRVPIVWLVQLCCGRFVVDHVGASAFVCSVVGARRWTTIARPMVFIPFLTGAP